MFSLISLIVAHWYIPAAILGLSGGWAWYKGLIVFRDLAVMIANFVQTRKGVAIISLVVGLAVGYASRTTDVDLERLRSENAAMQRDVEIASKAKESASARLSEVASRAFANAAKVAELESDLTAERSKPAPEPKIIVKESEPKVIVKTVPKVVIRSCPMNDEEVRRLKEIR